MILLIHAMPRTFAVHSEAVQLAGKPDCEIADIDHFLYFAHSFLETFAHLITDKFTKGGFIFTKFIADLATVTA